jgi:hypothetical protein
MNKQRFQEYLKNPALMNESSVSELKQILEAFPWFQTAHMLYVKALSNVNHFDYYSSLKKSSIAVSDRALLYQLIKQETQSIELEEQNVIKSEVSNTVLKAENKQDFNLDTNVSNEVDEIKFDSNASITSNLVDIQVEKVEKQVDIPSNEIKTETSKKIELQVTTKPNTREEVASVGNVENENKDNANTIRRDEVKQPVLDEIILNPVVNAYIEKEVLQVTEINKKNTSTSQNENFDENSEKTKSILNETLNEPHSFSEWLKLLAQNKSKGSEIIRSEDQNSEHKKTENPIKNISSKDLEEKKRRLEIMDKIIQNEPGHIRMSDSPEFFNPSKSAKGSNREDDTLVTETLAWIYEQQGNFPKAIRAYHTLSLKFPEKSVYFASLIQKIKLKQKQK